jgi:hypothetical protein
MDGALASGRDVNSVAEELMQLVEATASAEKIASAENEIGLWLAERARLGPKPALSFEEVASAVSSVASPEIAEAILARSGDKTSPDRSAKRP